MQFLVHFQPKLLKNSIDRQVWPGGHSLDQLFQKRVDPWELRTSQEAPGQEEEGLPGSLFDG